MSVKLQTILLCLGVAAFAVAATLLGLAIRMFFRDDIRGVMDDLSGRRRAVEVGAGRGRRRVPAGSRRSHATDTAETAPPVAAVGAKAPVPSAPEAPAPQPSVLQPSATAAALPSAGLPLRAVRATSAVAADEEDAVETTIDEDGTLTVVVSKRWDDPEATTVRPSRPSGRRLRSE